MATGLDSSAGATIFFGFHAGPRTPGIIAHTYAFDSIMVNGRRMNEPGIKRARRRRVRRADGDGHR